MESRILRRIDDYVWRDIGGEVVILNTEGTQVCLLNETAASVWTRCDGAHDLGAIARDIEREYDVSPNEALADVAALAAQLVEAGLAEWAEANAT